MKDGDVDREDVRRHWSHRGFSCGLWTDPPGRIWRDYRHDSDELFMLVDGEIELEVEGKAVVPRPGQEIVIPALARHTVRNIGSTVSHWLYGYRR